MENANSLYGVDANEKEWKKDGEKKFWIMSFPSLPEYFIESDVPIAFLKTFSQVAIQLEIINSINLHH